MTFRLLLLNGSLRGTHGNSARLLQRAANALPATWHADALCLADYRGTVEALADRLSSADAFLDRQRGLLGLLGLALAALLGSDQRL